MHAGPDGSVQLGFHGHGVGGTHLVRACREVDSIESHYVGVYAGYLFGQDKVTDLVTGVAPGDVVKV